jgi:AcrR family transcriptional regulator
MNKEHRKVRLGELVRAATDVFIEKGYRRTQMADITNAVGLSAGAIYRYVESKEALFDQVVRVGAGKELGKRKLVFPLPTPRSGATLAFLQETLRREGRIASLERALTRRIVEDPVAELEAIIRELYAKTARYRVGIKLLDRSALDWPELAALWSGHWRANLVKRLARYLQLRISRHVFRAVPEARAWARLMVETIAFFALHRHYDPHPTPMDEKVAEETAVTALVRAMAADAGAAVERTR